MLKPHFNNIKLFVERNRHIGKPIHYVHAVAAARCTTAPAALTTTYYAITCCGTYSTSHIYLLTRLFGAFAPRPELN